MAILAGHNVRLEDERDSEEGPAAEEKPKPEPKPAKKKRIVIGEKDTAIDDPIRLYLREIGKENLLTAEQEVDLARVKAVNAGATAPMMEAWRTGQGDYFHEQGPYPQQLAHEAVAHIVASVGEVIGPVAWVKIDILPPTILIHELGLV